MKVIGIILIIMGLTMVIQRSIQYSKKEKVVDTDAVEIIKKEPKVITWPYYAGGIAIVAGIILILLDIKRTNGSKIQY